MATEATPHKALGATLQAARERAKLSQHALSEKLGVRAMAVSRWERGCSVPHARHLPEIAKAIDLPYERLVLDVAASVAAASAAKASGDEAA